MLLFVGFEDELSRGIKPAPVLVDPCDCALKSWVCLAITVRKFAGQRERFLCVALVSEMRAHLLEKRIVEGRLIITNGVEKFEFV